MSESEIMNIYKQGGKQVVELVKKLLEENDALKNQLKESEKRLNRTSKNSSQPPSMDGFKKPTTKPKSLREKSKKKQGGQPGHKGVTLTKVENPDHVILHQVDLCQGCGNSLTEIVPKEIKTRQVFDLPRSKVEVTEHQVVTKYCPKCGMKNQGAFPTAVTQPTQYGVRLKATVVYLSQYQLLPYERLSQLIEGLYGQRISKGTLVSINKQCFRALKPAEDAIRKKLLDEPVLHADETGCYTGGNRQWLHVLSSPTLTYYQVHKNRGYTATEEIGVLGQYQKTIIHDHWATYFKYEECTHAMCNVHYLRELNGIIEFDKREWATKMKKLLLEMKAYSETYSYPLNETDLEEFEERYEAIVEQGLQEELSHNPPTEEGKKGRKKQTKSKNLLDRLERYQEEALEFLHQQEVPFDNNLAERDIRMTKVKQKVSGCFRSNDGASHFSRIRGYISTMAKQGFNLLEGLLDAFMCKPHFA